MIFLSKLFETVGNVTADIHELGGNVTKRELRAMEKQRVYISVNVISHSCCQPAPVP